MACKNLYFINIVITLSSICITYWWNSWLLIHVHDILYLHFWM